MASNRELRREASALGVALGVEVSTQGKNNAELAALVDSLRARANALEKKLEDAVSKDDMKPADGGAKPKVDEAEPEAPDQSPATQDHGPRPKGRSGAAKYPYEVAPGRALMGTLKGSIRAGQEVKASYFPRGKEQLDELVKKGFVLSNSTTT